LAAPDSTGGVYLSQVAGDAHVMPGVVVELAVDGLHQGLERPRAQVDDEPHGAALQRQVDVVRRLAGVQHEAVALQRAEGERDLVGAALDGRQREVIAEELVALEGGDRLLFTWEGRKEGRKEKGVQEIRRDLLCDFAKLCQILRSRTLSHSWLRPLCHRDGSNASEMKPVRRGY